MCASLPGEGTAKNVTAVYKGYKRK